MKRPSAPRVSLIGRKAIEQEINMAAPIAISSLQDRHREISGTFYAEWWVLSPRCASDADSVMSQIHQSATGGIEPAEGYDVAKETRFMGRDTSRTPFFYSLTMRG